MANKLDPMDLKQIITLHLDGFSNRKIAQQLGISRNTVNTYMSYFQSSTHTFANLLEMSNSALNELFTAHTTIKNQRYDELQQYFDRINQARNHPGFTFTFHYKEYSEQVKNPYSFSQFMEHYNRKYKKEKGSMKLEHIAGNEVFIDYAGKKLEIVNRETGEITSVEVFVAILPNSQYTYVEASMNQKRESLIQSMGNALSFFGGVPKAIVSDNLKSAVKRASKYEAEVNRTFKDFARHYNCVVNPTRAYSPQDKALVENAVQLAYQRIYYPLRNITFFSLADLNKEIRRLLDDYNNLLFQRKEASRKELFQSVERQYLKPLPQTKYELKDYRRAKVQKMGYVYFSPDKNNYSVPYQYIGKTTQIHYTGSVVEVYYKNKRIALHKRSPAKGVYITDKNHLSSTHKAYTQWSPDYFEQLAKPHGENVVAVIQAIFRHVDYPETSYKRAMGIIQLHRSYGSKRLNAACLIALYAETYSYKRICNILKNSLDLQVLEIQKTQKENQPHIPPHDNLRGSANYN